MSRPATLLVQLQSPSNEWVDVGLLHGDGSRNWFEFVESYWDVAHRPVLGQIFEEHGRAWRPNAHVALPRWFSHLLPEGQLREAVAKAAEVNKHREFDLIRRLGSTDLPGAVRIVEAVEGAPGMTIPTLVDDHDDNKQDPLLKFSLAGAQLKFSVHGDERSLTVPARGRAGNCILKLPDSRPGFSGVPEVELGALELARAAGIQTPNVWLVDLADVTGLEEWARPGSGRALAVQRFDRRDGDNRVHMEELAQILDVPTARTDAKYRHANFETVAIFVAALAGVDSVGEVIDRVVLNVLIGNGDAHLKNWAFVYPDGRHPILSPVYDVLPTVLYLPQDDLGLNLDRNKEFAEVTVESFSTAGARSGYGVEKARNRAKSAVERIVDRWTLLADFIPQESFRILTDRLGKLGLTRTRNIAP